MNILVSLSLLALCSVAVCGQVNSNRDIPGHYETEYGDDHQDKREATDVADDRSAEAQPEAWGGYGHGLLYGLYGHGLYGHGLYGHGLHSFWKRSAEENELSGFVKRSADPIAWGGYGLGLGYDYGGLYGLYGHGFYGHGLYGHDLHSFWKRSTDHRKMSKVVKRSAHPGYGHGYYSRHYGHHGYGHTSVHSSAHYIPSYGYGYGYGYGHHGGW